MKEIALTIDDLPRYEFTSAYLSPTEIINNIIKILANHQVSDVYGFMNGNLLDNHPQDIAIISAWLANGHKLGNHTYSHFNAGQIEPPLFIRDIEKNSLAIKTLASDPFQKLFRFPYLMEGSTHQQSQIIRAYLDQQHYQVAEVTVDYLDFAWDKPLETCLKAQRFDLIDKLRQLYVETALLKANNAREAAQTITQRDIQHIALTHCCLATAYFLDDVMLALINDGWRFVPLVQAVKDPFYQRKPVNIQQDGPTFLMRIVSDLQLDLANNKPCVPFQQLNALQQEALNSCG